MQSDQETMSYNAGYNVSYNGYRYDTGCIDFPDVKWKEKFDKRIKKNKFFAYLKNEEANELVGYVNYHYNKSDYRYDCGIVIEASKRDNGYSEQRLILLCKHAKEKGITSLYDNFEKDRPSLKIFKSVGFEIVEELTWKKFGKLVDGVLIKITL